MQRSGGDAERRGPPPPRRQWRRVARSLTVVGCMPVDVAPRSPGVEPTPAPPVWLSRLASGFVLLAHGDCARARLAALRDPVWDRLGVVRVAVLPMGTDATADGWGVRAVVDDEDALAGVLARFAGHALLLRPDHYVAALIPFVGPEPATRAVARLVGKSWGAAEGR